MSAAERTPPHTTRRDEFTNFMFLERAQQAAGEGTADNWRLFPQARARGARVGLPWQALPQHTNKQILIQPAHKRVQEFRDKNEPSSFHRDAIDRVHYVPQADKYVTCSRDGSFRRGGTRARLFCLFVLHHSV